MSDTITRRMLKAYNQKAEPTMFLSGMFQSPAENFYNGQEVEIDIVRSDEEVAVVVTDLSTGYRMNTDDLYTNKSFVAPAFKEAFPINVWDLLKRTPGNNPFVDPNFQAEATVKAFNGFRKIEAKIRRAIELQASQILQTGVLTLVDTNGTALYELDFQPKITHFPTASVAWDDTNPDMAGDINALAEVIRNDGLQDPDELDMGVTAYETALADDNFRKRFVTDQPYQGRITPMERRGNGGTFRGVAEIGNYKYDIYTYAGRYNDIETGIKTQYLDPTKVIVRASGARLDKTFGAIPRIVPPDSRVLKYLPGRMSNAAGGMDMFVNVWVTPDGEQLFGGLGSRPLLIPTAIDTYGCLDTDITVV